tara:strand:- start:326 stop:709 length:384 start_codon:yes stop_codon:yes gene_type:complete
MKKILVVYSNYYEQISNDMLLDVKKLLKNKHKIKLIKVPGVFEIPIVISKYLNKFDGCIAIGCVIKGQTPHFNFISNAVTNAIMDLSIKHKKPIANAVLTCLNKKQALARVKKGKEAGVALISVLKI